MIVAAVVFAAFTLALAAVTTTPERRNPHTKARRNKWHTRNPH